MRESRFTEEQILGVLQVYAAGAKVSEHCRKHGMSDATLYKWKAKYGGMTVVTLMAEHQFTQRRACRLVGIYRRTRCDRIAMRGSSHASAR